MIEIDLMNAEQPHGRPTRQCTAKSKRSGERCKRDSSPGRTVCNIHGGKSPVGVASPNFRTGRYSKHMPAMMLDNYHAALNDPDLLALDDELGVIDARMNDLLQRVEQGESGRVWDLLGKARQEVDDARAVGDLAAQASGLSTIWRLIERGLGDRVAWAEFFQLADQRRRTSESERKRLVELEMMLPVEQAMAFHAALGEAVREIVTDPKQVRQIADRMAQLVNRPAP